MSNQTDVFSLSDRSKPGVRRDGTVFDSPFYRDAQWVRFQRGRPKKMGGYRLVSDLLAGPANALFVDSAVTQNTAHVFSPKGVEQVVFDSNGVGGAIYNRNPAGLAWNSNHTSQVDSLFDVGGGSNTQLVCSFTPDLDSIASDATGGLYYGSINGTGALTQILDGASPILVSGGLVVLQPYLFVYGSNGLIRNSDVNDIGTTGWSGGDANQANVAGTKIVRGLPVRGGGQSPAGIFWALDSLIRVSYIGGTALWSYDPVSSNTTVMSKSCMLEYDGIFFWMGVDRFYSYNGVVQELPNDMNQNYVFDNLNYAWRQKVFALKVTRYGEIWWFYPSGSSTECDRAVIFNVRENTWYDCVLERSAGASARVFTLPLMAGEETSTTLLTLSGVVGAFQIGEIVTGGTSGATGEVVKALPTSLDLTNTSAAFTNGEVITGGTSGATGTTSTAPQAAQLTSLWVHETGTDRIVKQDVVAIDAHFETAKFSWMTGGPVAPAPAGANMQTRLSRLEPDFVQSGSMSVTIRGRSFAQSEDVDSQAFALEPDTEFIEPREQRREMSLIFRSNEAGGNFEMGEVLTTVEPGDFRG